jgi:hypothetical protein
MMDKQKHSVFTLSSVPSTTFTMLLLGFTSQRERPGFNNDPDIVLLRNYPQGRRVR